MVNAIKRAEDEMEHHDQYLNPSVLESRFVKRILARELILKNDTSSSVMVKNAGKTDKLAASCFLR